MLIKRSTTVQLRGRGSLRLGPSDHLATGGEGAIYRSGQTVVKLYLDQTKMQREGIADKIDLLAGLHHPYIVAPHGLVEDGQGRPIGWYMDYADGDPLARAFTTDWRRQHHFGDSEASVTATRMMDVVHYAHDHKAVMADANELNWMVVTGSKNGPEPRCLDIDSWALGRWPARAIMPSIRDWHTRGLTSLTDWFAWGIVTFQLYTGIHPYKGTLAGYKPGELERRMRDNASVFSQGVRLNRAVRDFSAIPGPLLDWYQATFQDGVRTEPPSPLERQAPKRQVRAARVTVAPSGALQFQRLYDGSQDPAVRVFACGVIQLASGRLYDLVSGRMIGAVPVAAKIVRVDGGWLAAWIRDAKVEAVLIGTNLQTKPVTTSVTGRQLLQTGERLFVTGNGLTELKLMMLGHPVLAAGQSWGALASTEWFDEVGVQNTLGSVHVIMPFGANACAQVRVPELDQRRVITAQAGSRLAAFVVLDKDGSYRKLELSFDRDHRTYTVWNGPADGPELNMAILPRGVAATIVRDGELVIFVPSNGDTKRVQDAAATTDLVLGRWDNAVTAIRDGSVWRLSLQT